MRASISTRPPLFRGGVREVGSKLGSTNCVLLAHAGDMTARYMFSALNVTRKRAALSPTSSRVLTDDALCLARWQKGGERFVKASRVVLCVVSDRVHAGSHLMFSSIVFYLSTRFHPDATRRRACLHNHQISRRCVALVLHSISILGELKVTYDSPGGQLRVEGPEATKDTFEELLCCLNSSLSFFGMVSTREGTKKL